jgi:hypothetical protein
MPRSIDLRHFAIAALIGSGVGLLGASATGIASLDDAIRAAEPAPTIPVIEPSPQDHRTKPQV